MKILRIFLKGDTHVYCDAPIPDTMTMNDAMHTFRLEGHLRTEGPGAPWAVPWDGWAFAYILTMPDNEAKSWPQSWPQKMPEGEKPN